MECSFGDLQRRAEVMQLSSWGRMQDGKGLSLATYVNEGGMSIYGCGKERTSCLGA